MGIVILFFSYCMEIIWLFRERIILVLLFLYEAILSEDRLGSHRRRGFFTELSTYGKLPFEAP